jgi:hypothetical protein
MQPADRERLVRIVAVLCETFGRTPSEATFFGYELGLADLPVDKVEAAALQAIRTCRFMPTVNELRQLAGELTPDARALVAWDESAAAARRLGSWPSVRFGDPATAAVVRSLGGWPGFVGAVLANDEWTRKDFLKQYATRVASGYIPRVGLLLGRDAAENQWPGHPPHETANVPTSLPTLGEHVQIGGLVGDQARTVPLLSLKSVD